MLPRIITGDTASHKNLQTVAIKPIPVSTDTVPDKNTEVKYFKSADGGVTAKDTTKSNTFSTIQLSGDPNNIKVVNVQDTKINRIRVNGGEPTYIILDADNKVKNVTMKDIKPEQIASINVIKNDTSASKYGTVLVRLKDPGNTMSVAGNTFSVGVKGYVQAFADADVVNVVKVNGTYLLVAKNEDVPGSKDGLFSAYSNLIGVNVNKGDKIVRGQTIGTVTVNPATGKSNLVFELDKGLKLLPSDTNNAANDGSMLVALIDLANVNNADLKDEMKLFKDNGFNLDIHESGDGKSIKISVKSHVKGSSASASYETNGEDVSKYLIYVKANKTNGEVSIKSQDK